MLRHRRSVSFAAQFLAERGIGPVGPEGLPPSFDDLLAPAEIDIFASRLWFDTLIRHALPETTRALMVSVGPPGAMLVPLRAWNGHVASLTTTDTLHWRPLTAAWAGTDAMEAAATELGMLLRDRPPTVLRAMDRADAVYAPFVEGLRRAGLQIRSFQHFGNRYEALPRGMRWVDYLATRDEPLRRALDNRRAGWQGATQVDLLRDPGPELEDGIAAALAVGEASGRNTDWSPRFDAALMRGAAAAGLLRLGILRGRRDRRPLAAQYWIVSGGQAHLMRHVTRDSARPFTPWLTLTEALVQAVIEEEVGVIDLGRGNEACRRLWVKARRQRIGLLVADPRHPAGAIALARHAIGHARRRLRRLLGTTMRAEGQDEDPL